MLAVAREDQVYLGLFTDISTACGSQAIYLEARSGGMQQAGQDACAALLVRHGFEVASQRDHRTLGLVLRKLDPSVAPNLAARDHHETYRYVEHLGAR